MKARFYLKTPPGEFKPVEYVDIDPDDTGRNVVGKRADYNLRSRFPEEYGKFQLELKESGYDANSATPVAADSVAVRIPPSVLASMPIGGEEEALRTTQGTATGAKTQENIEAAALKAASPEGARAVAQLQAEKQSEAARTTVPIQAEKVSVGNSPASAKLSEVAKEAEGKLADEKAAALEEAQKSKDAADKAAEASKQAAQDASKEAAKSQPASSTSSTSSASSSAFARGSVEEREANLTADEREEFEALAKASGMTLREVLADEGTNGRSTRSKTKR